MKEEKKLDPKGKYTHHAYIGREFELVSQTGSVAIVVDENGCRRQVDVEHLRKV